DRPTPSGCPAPRHARAMIGKPSANRIAAQPNTGRSGTAYFTATAFPPQSAQHSTTPATPPASIDPLGDSGIVVVRRGVRGGPPAELLRLMVAGTCVAGAKSPCPGAPPVAGAGARGLCPGHTVRRPLFRANPPQRPRVPAAFGSAAFAASPGSSA